ncbi:MAG: carbon-nitrogen hydrolase family protein [Campylobacterota bacterium]|nr:carbon-nitrogen hydrolase family protein [Campylobacterota bacterium]
MNLVTLQFKTTEDFNQNLRTLTAYIKNTLDDSIVVAPELCLNGYAYDRLDEAVAITQKAIKELLELSKNKTIITTLTTKYKNSHQNTLHLFHKGKILHTQSKNKLFILNDERKYFSPGEQEDIKIIDMDGIKIGFVICFELRFIDFWQQLKGADIICIPSMWGLPRKEHFETLCQALAVANQCYVVASNSSNDDMASSSAIITPFGIQNIDDKQEKIEQNFDYHEIKKMRRYMNIGIPY